MNRNSQAERDIQVERRNGGCHGLERIDVDKVRKYEEIMTNDDNLESNLLTSSLLKISVLSGTS